MAYTYNDFLSAANSAGLYGEFDEDDLQRAQKTPEYGLSLLGLKQDYNKATTDEQRLLVNENINQLRNNYGTETPTAPMATPSGRNIGFSYNAAEDPSYQAMRKQYLREGDRATENALGSAAAASAGRPSSYAVTAATQAGDYYAGQLADRIPTLEQNAYSRALDEFNAGKAKYESIKETITSSGYMPTDEELAQAGMTKEEAAQWRKVWGWQAYQNGQISGEQYKELFGEYPNGYVQPGAGWYGGGGSNPDTKTASGESTIKPADVSRLVLSGMTIPQIGNYIVKNGGTATDVTKAVGWAKQMGAQGGTNVQYGYK